MKPCGNPMNQEIKKNNPFPFLLCFLFLGISSPLFSEKAELGSHEKSQEEPIVIGELSGQAGNNFFQIAAASALAWDNGVEAYFPNLAYQATYRQHFFSRVNILPPHENISFEWHDRGRYEPIPYEPNMLLKDYFQSEKYFSHYRDRLLELFAPTERDLKYIFKKYKWLIDHPNTVGVQIRLFWDAKHFPQYGQDYLEKALAHFSEDCLFIVSTNRLDFAKTVFPSDIKNVVFLENEHFYIEFYLLSMCKHNIIVNSTFGWWAAWLNQNENKKIVCPYHWLPDGTSDDKCPKEWIVIDAKIEKPEHS